MNKRIYLLVTLFLGLFLSNGSTLAYGTPVIVEEQEFMHCKILTINIKAIF